MKKTIIIGTAGHIDHGKTSLVKALTGVDTDRLPEEKARGITIDLGFAHRDLGDTQISFIDVPGHERFVRNMLAGIGGIDLLMLVVAADESVMPQTREHFDICRLLGIRAGMIVLTKTDLVDPPALEAARRDVAALVAGSFLEGAPVCAVSARTGEGLEALQQELRALCVALPQRSPAGFLRLPVDRVFTLKGHGTVVTGTLISGTLNRDQSIEILPSHRKSRVRSIHAHDEQVETATAGQRTAVNLMSVEKEEISRGDVLTEPDVFENASLLDVKLTLLRSARPLAHNALVRFHHQASDVLARVTLLGRNVLDPGDSCYGQLRLQRPLFALYGDRFILRRQSPQVTIAGGVVLNHVPRKRLRRSDGAALERMQLLEDAGPEQRCAVLVSQRGIQGADEAYLRAGLAMEASAIRTLRPASTVRLREQPLLLLSADAEARILQRMRDAVAAFHKKNPLLSGIVKEELRTKYLPGVQADVFSACLERAVAANRFRLIKDTVALTEHRVALSREEEDLSRQVEQALLRSGLEFPGVVSLAEALKRKVDEVKKILYLLVRQSQAIKLGDDYFLSRGIWEDLKSRVRALKGTKDVFSVPDFKDRFGVSRKYAIPILEQLDREGITRRRGNERIIS